MQDNRIIISRTDNIGDVILTLPIAGVLKELYPGCEILFLGKKYTRPIIETCKYIDQFVDWDAIKEKATKDKVEKFKALNAKAIIHVFPNSSIAFLSKKANIPLRIGTNRRWYHLFTCNRLVNLSRRRSSLHEAQLNLRLIAPLNVNSIFSLEELSKYYGLANIKTLKEELHQLIDTSKFNLIIHPKSKGSAREWGLDNFSNLIDILPQDKFKIFLTGTKEEEKMIKESVAKWGSRVINLMGQVDLEELISFIAHVDGIVAASTGPLHIAAAFGKHAVGLYAPMRSIHPGRWQPIGIKATYFVQNKKCDLCKKHKQCECMHSIDPYRIKAYFDKIIPAN